MTNINCRGLWPCIAALTWHGDVQTSAIPVGPKPRKTRRIGLQEENLVRRSMKHQLLLTQNSKEYQIKLGRNPEMTRSGSMTLTL